MKKILIVIKIYRNFVKKEKSIIYCQQLLRKRMMAINQI